MGITPLSTTSLIFLKPYTEKGQQKKLKGGINHAQ
jgi:hypothetical protein